MKTRSWVALGVVLCIFATMLPLAASAETVASGGEEGGLRWELPAAMIPGRSTFFRITAELSPGWIPMQLRL